jgi:transcriptional regulator GlxA family with amidase domain
MGPQLKAKPAPLWDVLFLLLPDSLILDWAGPAEALRIANQATVQQGKPAPFRLRFVSPLLKTVSSVGVTIAGLEPLQTAFVEPSWVVLLGQPGHRLEVDSSTTQTALRWLETMKLKSGELELLTICAGAVLAAHAGLLNGRRATTHHQHLEELQSVAPTCQVVSNRVFVEDAPVFSSAGVTTGVDLMLQRISQVCGAAIAAQVAQTMVVSMRRGPQDPELSPFLAHRNHLHPAVHRVQDAISHAPAQDWDLAAMSSIAHTSPRHLTRLFVEHASVAPLAYLRQIRLAVAQHALRSGRNVTQAAEMAGFSSDTQLRRTWRQFGPPGTPSQTGEQGIQETR